MTGAVLSREGCALDAHVVGVWWSAPAGGMRYWCMRYWSIVRRWHSPHSSAWNNIPYTLQNIPSSESTVLRALPPSPDDSVEKGCIAAQSVSKIPGTCWQAFSTTTGQRDKVVPRGTKQLIARRSRRRRTVRPTPGTCGSTVALIHSWGGIKQRAMSKKHYQRPPSPKARKT